MKILNITFNHLKLYYFGLVLTVIFLPISKFALSVSMVFLLTNWILEGNFKYKVHLLLKNKGILIFLGVFIVHVVWLINTANFQYAFHDLGNKIILVLYPVVIGTSGRISLHKQKKIVIWFVLATVLSSLISTLIFIKDIQTPGFDTRNISIFMSHIRLSLLVNASIFSLIIILVYKKFPKTKIEIAVYIGLALWLTAFLYLLRSFTGIAIFLIIFFAILGYISFKINDLIPRLFLRISLITIFLLIASYLTHSISKFYKKEIVEIATLDKHTQSGGVYEHSIINSQIENGNYVSVYICKEELEKEWNKVSLLPYSGKDSLGQDLSFTLIRYLTSKGLRKDSSGISKLTKADIKNVEQGLANYIYADKYSIYPIIYKALWQIDVYRKGYNPAGNSITQRIEFVKTGLHIIKKNFWFGVGTGDVQDSFNKQYVEDRSELPAKWRLRAHNQFVTFFISFGLIGFCIIFFSILYPIIRYKKYKNYLFIVFFFIALLSFINEDTLETQIGITFFGFFYSLFFFGDGLKLNKEEKHGNE